MDIIEIEQNGDEKYTEESKYYSFSIEKFEKVFRERYLNWDYYLNNATKESNKGGVWSLSIRDILTDELRDYDSFIQDFYNTEVKKGIPLNDIYLQFSKTCKYCEFKNNSK